MKTFRIGIDLGGTKIELVVLDETDHIIHKQRIVTPHGDYDHTLDSICNLVWEAEHLINQKCSVGIGTPGAISQKTGLLKNSNSTCLNDKPIQQDLEQKLGRKIRLSNDANCFTLSEACDGAAAGSQNVFGVIIGTGTGAGIVINQQIVEGANRIAGEWGHNPMPWPNHSEIPGPTCYCGLSGCIETFLSGPGLEADYLRSFNTALNSHEIVAGAVAGDTAAKETMIESKKTYNPNCEAALQRYEERLARALSHVINILDPDTIVLGGGMSNIKRLYENVPRLWGKYVFSDLVLTKLKPPKHGDSSGVRGAARLWAIGENDGRNKR
ncbi:MAG: ROK family protein [Gammaproteobacteria bacterium]|nr:ROK family protein [Gammaproteobacteria bacterium]